MNFLDLVRAAWSRAGQSGDGPASVTGMSGHQQRFVDYVRDAWFDVQQEHDEWVFLKSSGVFSTVAAQEDYMPSLLSMLDFRVPYVAFVYVDNRWCEIKVVVADSARNEYLRANKQSGRPNILYFSNGVISFDTIPDAAEQIKIHYRKKPQELSANADIPWCDDSYHRAIFWAAVRSYATDDQDQALFNRANTEYEKVLYSMLKDLTPKITFGQSAF